METPNPKCKVCGCYWKPEGKDIKPSGLVAKSCPRCREYQQKIRNNNKCEHNRQKSNCKECGGSSFCEHDKIKSRCKECGGGSICEHNKRKSECKECGGSSICEHDRRKSTCKECKGGSICEHNRQKSHCKECKGGSICEHNRRKSNCKECNLQQYLLNLQRNSIRRLLGLSNLDKDRSSIEYLGITNQGFIDFFQKKMDLHNNTNDVKMNWNNIHIDHIKPVSIFDLDDAEEFLQCANYTNLQPLLSNDNLEKHNKWNDKCEIFWNENIRDNNSYYDIYNPFKV